MAIASKWKGSWADLLRHWFPIQSRGETVVARPSFRESQESLAGGLKDVSFQGEGLRKADCNIAGWTFKRDPRKSHFQHGTMPMLDGCQEHVSLSDRQEVLGDLLVVNRAQEVIILGIIGTVNRFSGNSS